MQQMRAAGGAGRGPWRGGRAGVPRGLRGGQRTLRPADPRGRSRWGCPGGRWVPGGVVGVPGGCGSVSGAGGASVCTASAGGRTEAFPALGSFFVHVPGSDVAFAMSFKGRS